MIAREAAGAHAIGRQRRGKRAERSSCSCEPLPEIPVFTRRQVQIEPFQRLGLSRPHEDAMDREGVASRQDRKRFVLDAPLEIVANDGAIRIHAAKAAIDRVRRGIGAGQQGLHELRRQRVVGVKKHDPFGPQAVQTRVARAGDAGMRDGQDLNAFIPRRGALRDVGGVVARTVVHNNSAPVAPGLRRQARQGLRQRRRGVVSGDHDADCGRRAHRASPPGEAGVRR